jgi:hypothetical protein
MNRNELQRAARRELDESRRWWNNDSNFAPILSRHIAERWRSPAYAVGVALVIVVLGRLMHVEINWTGTAIGVAPMVLVAIANELIDVGAGDVGAGDVAEGRRLPATGETIRLGEVGRE